MPTKRLELFVIKKKRRAQAREKRTSPSRAYIRLAAL